MSGLANGFAQLFKAGGKRFGNAIDNFWLDAEARKAISDEVGNKFKPFIDRANTAASRRATNITELGNKLAESKKALQDAKDKWQRDYDAALADARNQRQTEIDNYDAELQRYQNALDQANQGRQDIVDKLYQQEATYTPNKTIYTDINTGDKYLKNPITGEYKNITTIFKNASKEQQRKIRKYMQGFEERLFDSNSKKVINAFDENISNTYHGKNTIFDNYLDRIEAPQYTAFKNADKQINQANTDLATWNSNNTKPSAWNDVADSKKFKQTYKKTNSEPNEYSFNGQTYSKEADLDQAYQNALKAEQTRKDLYSRVASGYVSKRDKEIAKRIQDAKDIKKAKLALGVGAGAGALAAGAAAIYGGDDTDNTDNINNTNNIDNTDNTYTGEPDPDLNIENTPEGKAALIGKSLVDTDFDPDKADALARAAYDQGVEDSNSVRSSDIAAATGGHTIDDRLFELIKAMKDPYKADAIANYIYSRHGDDPEVQRLGWRGWLNKYYGDSLRSKMNIDPSGYKGMHISGGL